jgi:hypothetical protein
MARDVKEARLIVLPRTGHMPHYSALEVTTDLIEQTADRAGFAASLSQGGDKRGSHAETPGFAPPLFKKFGLSSVEET